MNLTIVAVLIAEVTYYITLHFFNNIIIILPFFFYFKINVIIIIIIIYTICNSIHDNIPKVDTIFTNETFKEKKKTKILPIDKRENIIAKRIEPPHYFMFSILI